MSPSRRLVAATLAMLACLGFVALGTWQVHRRAWKLALIDAVETRVHAAPVAAPAPGVPVDAAHDAYRHVRVTGRYDGTRQTLVQASTDRGPGWWVMTPLAAPGRFVLVNRGLVAAHAAPPPPTGPVTVTGLLRLTEPGGGFLRGNDSTHDRWFSRDVAAIARARRLAHPAAYFIDADADAAPERPGQPIGGLTVIRFDNNHLVYALTWYALAIMSALAALFVLRRPPR